MATDEPSFGKYSMKDLSTSTVETELDENTVVTPLRDWQTDDTPKVTIPEGGYVCFDTFKNYFT